MTSDIVQNLTRRQVIIHNPASVYIGPEVRPERIGQGVIIHPGCRILGETTSIGPGTELGAEAPVTLKNCQLGHRVLLAGGFFEGAVFLDRSGMGSGAHVRGGTILEEEASGAHTVGLKQTILFPFVTLGSLINFCDVFMAGGTSRKNHSEVGSSYIHFNFSGQQDKATASLVGDVPRGLLLNQKPIFLGGQGGLVGPVIVEYGCIIGAGSICRKDLLIPDQVVVLPLQASERANPGPVYMKIDRKLANNLEYLGNLSALKAWYLHVRAAFMKQDIFRRYCLEGALANLDKAIEERLKRLDDFVAKLQESATLLQKMEGDWNALIEEQLTTLKQWPSHKSHIQEVLSHPVPVPSAIAHWIAGLDTDSDYLHTIQAIGREQGLEVQNWLKDLVVRLVGPNHPAAKRYTSH